MYIYLQNYTLQNAPIPQQILGNHILGRATKYCSMVAQWATTFENDLSCPAVLYRYAIFY